MSERAELLVELEAIYREVKGTTRHIRPADRLAEDLDVDSLAGMELLVALEEVYDVELVGQPRAMEVRTVADLLAALAEAKPELTAKARFAASEH